MNQESRKITRFTDLFAWRKGHTLVIEIYKATQDFPSQEMFGLTSQLRRAAVSFTSNIAEGFSRRSYKDKANFYAIALGSLTELQNQILIARDIGYCDKEKFNLIAKYSIELNKITNGLIKKSKSLIHDS